MFIAILWMITATNVMLEISDCRGLEQRKRCDRRAGVILVSKGSSLFSAIAVTFFGSHGRRVEEGRVKDEGQRQSGTKESFPPRFLLSTAWTPIHTQEGERSSIAARP